MKSITVLAAVAAACVTAGAQNLSTEITVDRIVVPELRGADRMSVAPSILSLSGLTADITPAEYMGPGTVSNTLGILPPAPWRMSVGRTPYRGYVGAAIFPGMNAAANAGCRFVDTGTATVGAWLNYDGADYKHDGRKVKNHQGTIGAYAAFVMGEAGTLSIDAAGMLAGVSDRLQDSKTNYSLEGRAAWQGRAQSFSYNASVGGSYFRMGRSELLMSMVDGADYIYGPMTQAVLTFDAGGGACHSGESWRWIGLDIDGAIQKTKGAGTALGQYHFTPYVAFEASDYRFRLGAKLSVGSGPDDAPTRVAPSVSVAYAPERSLLGAEITVSGAESLNPMLALYEKNPFLVPTQYYGRTNIPVKVAGTLHFGRLGGFGAEVHAAYASARNLLLPGASHGYNYDAWNADTWIAGADISYAFRTLLVVGCGADMAGSNRSDGCVSWYEWTDRAKTEARAYVHSTPADKLDVDLDFTWRHDRRSAAVSSNYVLTESLGAIRSLDLDAAYRITPSLTAYLSLVNLLGHRYLLPCGLPSQGLHGLAGVSYKF